MRTVDRNLRVVDRNLRAEVHCPICTHQVEADGEMVGRKVRVVPGQRCPRCHSPLDAAMVLQVLQAA